MGRAPCCDKDNVKKGPWSPEEDAKLKEYIEKYGTGGNWIALPQKAGNLLLLFWHGVILISFPSNLFVTISEWLWLWLTAGLRRCGKSCRLRWLNYLRPNIKHGEFSDEEDKIICNLFASIGSRYLTIFSPILFLNLSHFLHILWVFSVWSFTSTAIKKLFFFLSGKVCGIIEKVTHVQEYMPYERYAHQILGFIACMPISLNLLWFCRDSFLYSVTLFFFCITQWHF